MASPDLQSKVNQLTAGIEGDLKTMVDEIERTKIRPLGRTMHACIVGCYDKAGKKGRKEQIEQCSQQCQAPYQAATAATQQEIANFQNRLNRSMMQCNDEAQGMVTPDMQDNARKMKRVEDGLLRCMKDAIDKGREGLRPMRQRIEGQMS